MPTFVTPDPWLLVALAPVLLAAGAWGHHVWAARAARRRRRIPRHWPLTPRALTNSEETLVWHWLVRTFYDHHVMIKLPVTRFTLPRDPVQSKNWFQLLGSVYCTFTICKADGRVIGCVDVPGHKGIPRMVRQIKYSLLTRCGLPYWVIRSDNLPAVADIRDEFLGDAPLAQSMREREQEERAIIAAQANLRSALNRQRQSRADSDFTPLSTWPSGNSELRPSDFNSNWGENSFLQPLGSRKGDLH